MRDKCPLQAPYFALQEIPVKQNEECGCDYLCRTLSESKLKAKLELSENQSGTLNECKRKAKHEFSERDKS